jgi:hypothetical protein
MTALAILGTTVAALGGAWAMAFLLEKTIRGVCVLLGIPEPHLGFEMLSFAVR